MKSYERRTRIEWVEEIKHPLTVDYSLDRQIKLACDIFNTHNIAYLYHAFPAPEAHALARRLEINYTPRNGSWLNIAEIELSVLHQQCLDRRISDDITLSQELQAWQDDRNASHAQVHWRFSTADARIKLHHLYPQF